MPSILPPVRATLQERYLFNFRMPTATFQHLVNDYAIVSFCTLHLRRITVAPLPTVVGLSSLSCAYRFAVIDTSGSTPAPAVFVPARYTNNAFGSWFTHLGFYAPHPLIHASITTEASELTLKTNLPDGQPLFSATVQPATACRSALFETAEAFAQFIKAGVTSYGTSVRGARLTKIDLHKTETAFEPLAVCEWQDSLLDRYMGEGVVLDSAFRTAGGHYQWTYHGLTPVSQHHEEMQATRPLQA